MMATFLNDVWCFYFHDPYDNKWTNESYKLLGTIGSVEEFWQHHQCISQYIQKGMFFMMREHVQPTWDDASNIDGGCLSIKVLKEDLPMFWEDICVKLLGESLLTEDARNKWDCVNGISCSPKKHFCIVKIWVKDPAMDDKSIYNLLKCFNGEILYKSNRDNIQYDQIKTKV